MESLDLKEIFGSSAKWWRQHCSRSQELGVPASALLLAIGITGDSSVN